MRVMDYCSGYLGRVSASTAFAVSVEMWTSAEGRRPEPCGPWGQPVDNPIGLTTG